MTGGINIHELAIVGYLGCQASPTHNHLLMRIYRGLWAFGLGFNFQTMRI